MEDVDMAQRDEEDPYGYRPPLGSSPREIRARWVAEGDIDAFLTLLREKPWSMLSVGEQFNNIMKACEVRAKADPASFSGEMFRRMVAFNAFLVLRTRLYVTERPLGRGGWHEAEKLSDFLPDAVERLLPRLQEMQRGMAELLAAQAGTALMRALARAKGSKPDLAGSDGADQVGPVAIKPLKAGHTSRKPTPSRPSRPEMT